MSRGGWLAGYPDWFDEMGEPLHEMIRNVEGEATVIGLYVADMEMLNDLR